MPKYPRYQDYVIRDGKLVGEFEQMYRDYEDPWEQAVRGRFKTEKAIALNLIERLKAEQGIKTVVELGCGFGDFSARVTELGLRGVGIDISETAVAKAIERHPGTEYVRGAISDHALMRGLAPDVIVMAEITWYVLDDLDAFVAFLKRDMRSVYLIHLLATYAPGVQKYGRAFFTNLDEIRRYFAFDYIESGLVQYPDGSAGTWFLGRP
jgi:predicted TPR repeat methyltransferase